MSKESNALVRKIIDDYYNKVYESASDAERSFDNPIIGYSKGNDPLYKFMKKDIGDFYWTPDEAFGQEFENFSIDELSVVSFVFPQTKRTKTANAAKSELTSGEWATHRLSGQKFLLNLMKHLVDELTLLGFRAMAPTLNENWSNATSVKYGYASSWSHRHIAYISGLGTFSLSDGLITSVGKAHRCGSIIVECNLEATERNYNSHLDYCLFYKDGSCNMCEVRCPANAITKDGHDKLRCREYQREIQRPHIKKEFDLDSSCCGLCQVGVPCESKIP